MTEPQIIRNEMIFAEIPENEAFVTLPTCSVYVKETCLDGSNALDFRKIEDNQRVDAFYKVKDNNNIL